MEDNQIIDLFFRRDEKALSELTVKYGAEMKAVAYQISRNREDSEEIFNDALMGVWNTIPPEFPRVLASYIFRIVRNLACKCVRKANAQKRGEALSMEGIMEELGDVFPAEEDRGSESAEIAGAINRFLEGCTEEERFIFFRRYYYFDGIADIAERLHKTEGAVKTQLSRFRSELGAYLKKEGIGL